MAHLPNPDDDPISVEDLIVERINRDVHTLDHFESPMRWSRCSRISRPTGTRRSSRSGWKNTPDGFDLLTGPPDETAGLAGRQRSVSTRRN
jgi:hypothetical protein